MIELDEILKKTCGSTVSKLLRKGVGQSATDLHKIVRDLLTLIRSSTYKINRDKAPILFIFDPNQIGESDNTLTTSYLSDFFMSGRYSICNIIYSDIKGLAINRAYRNKKILNLEEVDDDFEEDATAKENWLYVFVIRDEVTFINKGKIISQIPDVNSFDRRGEIRGRFNVKDYRTAIEDHYQKEIVGERGFKYWKKKADWQLVERPEEQFRKRLMSFLDQNLSGALVDEECWSNGDRTDIRVVELASNEIYIFEIKWMGKSAGGNIINQQAHDKANEGIDQLHTYLSQETKSICGLLIMYDARKDKFAIIWNPNRSEWDIRIDKEPILPGLDPTSASGKAKKNVQARKNSTG